MAIQDEEKKKAAQGTEKKTPSSPEGSIPSPQQRLADAKTILETIKIENDVESVKMGYKNLQDREAHQKDMEAAVQKREEAIAKREAEVEARKQAILDEYTPKIQKYNANFDLLQTKLREADRVMEEALQSKTEAEAIIQKQTTAEKLAMEKAQSYDQNMTEAMEVFGEIVSMLSKIGKSTSDYRVAETGRILALDLDLIERMRARNFIQNSTADVIAVDCDRLNELGEYLQDNGGKLRFDSAKLLSYLLDNTKWLTWALKIEWSPTNKQELKT